MADTKSTEYKAGLVARFIAEQHAAKAGQGRPLLVSMQGPQGAGKSTLASRLVEVLAESYGLTCAVASLDDFYLPYAGLRSLAQSHPSNKLLQGRGPPGTHDLPLLRSVLSRVRDGPAPSPASPVDLPSFDKSQHAGFGDRAPAPVQLVQPVDVFLLEGWSLGYMPVSAAEAAERRKAGRTASLHPVQSILDLNANLQTFDEATRHAFDCHVAVKPLSYDYVYAWRLQQEHHMKAQNGGMGMTDDEVEAFVDRYMPVYEVFGETGPDRPVLKLVFGPEREVVDA